MAATQHEKPVSIADVLRYRVVLLNLRAVTDALKPKRETA